MRCNSPESLPRGRRAAVWVLILGAGLIGACALGGVVYAAPAKPMHSHQARLSSEGACAEIRVSISRLAEAERNQAFALRLMPKGEPTPMVEARLAELSARIDDLRDVLGHVRHGMSPGDEHVNRCVDLGFKSLSEAEQVSSTVQQMVMSETASLGFGPHLNPSRLWELPPPGQPLPGRRVGPE